MARSEQEVRAVTAILPVAEHYGFIQDFYFDVLPWSCHNTSIIPQTTVDGFSLALKYQKELL